MKMELTQKDKKILLYLSIFVIIVCFTYWGIRPNAKKMKSLNNHINEVKQQDEINKQKMAELPMLEADCEMMEENIKKLRTNYFDMMTSDEIDKHFTGIVLDYNLYAYDLNIDMPDEEAKLSPYKYAELPEDFEETEGESEFSDEIPPTTGIYCAKINMKLGGDKIILAKLVDDFSKTNQKLRVVSYSYSNEDNIVTNNDGSYEIVNNTILNITMEIYMCEE